MEGFYFSQYEFHIIPCDRILFPSINKVQTLRGAFGTVFKKMVCVNYDRECADCSLKHICAYAAIFDPSPPENSERLSKNKNIPRPFLFRSDVNGPLEFSKEDTIVFNLIVVGKANDYLPYFIVTLREMGLKGIGKGRGKYKIQKIFSTNGFNREKVEIYDGQEEIVKNLECRIKAEDIEAKIPQRSFDTVSLHFLTPTIIKHDGILIRNPEFHHIIKRLRDRLSTLSYFYCDTSLNIDFKGFGERAEKVKKIKGNFKWHYVSRFSKKKNQVQDLSGFTGVGTYEGELSEYIPILYIGEYLNVGKAAAFGNGQYKIMIQN